MTTMKNRLGLAFAALLAGAEGCSSPDSLEDAIGEKDKIAVMGEFIGVNNDERGGCNGEYPFFYLVGLTLEYGGNLVGVCTPFSRHDVPNWKLLDGFYQMTLAPRRNSSGEVVRIKAFGESRDSRLMVPLFDGVGIAALEFPPYLETVAELTLTDSSGGTFCQQDQHLYGFRMPRPAGSESFHTSSRDFLACGNELDANYSNHVLVRGETTGRKDVLGRPIYAATELIKLDW